MLQKRDYHEYNQLFFLLWINKRKANNALQWTPEPMGSYLKGLFKNYTMGTLLDKLDVIECFEQKGHKIRIGEILQKQKDIYTALGVEPPDSL